VDFAQELFSTRRGTIIVGASAAILAAIVLIVYLHSYRNSLKGSSAPISVLVAKDLIQKGTPGEIVATRAHSQVGSIPKGQIQAGALTDRGSLTGLVAARDIYAGQQLSVADFVPAPPNSIQGKMSGSYRAIALSTDAEHGLLGQISAGDHVDIYLGIVLQGTGGNQPIIKLLATNLLVLRVPLAGSGQLTLRAPGRVAAQLAYAQDNGHLWFVLRPASDAKPVNPGTIDARSILNLKPVVR
jgi:Flp pilus assembly protein CpaB